jgi:hypothetical protein
MVTPAEVYHQVNNYKWHARAEGNLLKHLHINRHPIGFLCLFKVRSQKLLNLKVFTYRKISLDHEFGLVFLPFVQDADLAARSTGKINLLVLRVSLNYDRHFLLFY